MTNEEIDKIVADNERSAFVGQFFPAAISWMFSGVAALMSFLALSPVDTFLHFSIWFMAILSGVSAVATFGAHKEWKKRENNRARLLWSKFGDNHVFGDALSVATRQLGTEIQKIYNGEPSGALFPLRQSIQLLDTYNKQQQRLQIVESRLGELRKLQENLSSKMTQLRELGEDYPQGARNLEQINGDLNALGKVHGQIRASCARLEAIVIGVQKVTQSRELRRELEGLSARVAPSSGATEPAFAAESLEDIERQIGREIETYLQLERETDEHLR